MNYVVVVSAHNPSDACCYGPFIFRTDAESFISEHDNDFAGRVVCIINASKNILPIEPE